MPAAAPSVGQSGGQRKKGTAAWMAVLTLVVGGGAVGYSISSRSRVEHTAAYRARVIDVRGTTAVELGSSCSVRIEPAKGHPYNCRVVIRCGEHPLFGATPKNGFAHCTVAEGVVTEAHESATGDSDPDIHYLAATGKITVEDRTWQVDLEIDSK